MQLFLDTEFNGFGGELISLALVGTNGLQFYEVCELPGLLDPWVVRNVIPVLKKDSIRKLLFKHEFQQFIRQFDEPEIICDWHADAEHFCKLLAGFDYGSSLDFSCNIRILKTPPGQPVSALPHNALADATALRDWYLNADL